MQIIFHILGIDLTLRIAEKCMQDKTRITTLDQKPLLWSTDYCPKNNLYINVVIFLLKLNFCEVKYLYFVFKNKEKIIIKNKYIFKNITIIFSLQK